MAAKSLQERIELNKKLPRAEQLAFINGWNAATQAAEEKFASTNSGSPKLLDELELLIGKCVFQKIQQAWRVAEIIEQLRASA